MKILVTGSTGFVGQHVVRWLVNHANQNYEIIATGTSEEKARKFDWYDKVQFIPCDYFSVMDLNTSTNININTNTNTNINTNTNTNTNFYEFFGKPDLLIHLAWKGLPNYMERFHMEENLPVEIRFIRSFAESKHTKIAVTGTCYEYGVVEGCIAEDHPTSPNTVYSAAKDALRRYLEFLAKDFGMSWNWIRLFFLYGEGQSPKSLLPQLDAAIARGDAEFPMSGGEQLRDYLPVEKVAEYICRIVLSEHSGIVNCCSGKYVSVRRLVEERVAVGGANIRLKLGVYGYPVYEGMAFWGDDTKLREVIGGKE